MGSAEEIRVRSIRELTPEEHEDLLVRFGKKEPEVPQTLEYLYPILTVVPCQLIAYHCARYLNRDIDKPRNLAKSVTVE